VVLEEVVLTDGDSRGHIRIRKCVYVAVKQNTVDFNILVSSCSKVQNCLCGNQGFQFPVVTVCVVLCLLGSCNAHC